MDKRSSATEIPDEGGPSRIGEITLSILERLAGSIARALSCTMRRPDRLWWDQDLPLRVLQIKGREICFVTRGQGIPVVFVHGFGTCLSIWAEQIKTLGSHCQVFALDLLGHGYSDKPNIDYSPEIQLPILTGFLDALNLPSATFVGSSMGGHSLLCLAAMAPERVQRLVLVGSTSPFHRPLFYNLAIKRPRLWRLMLTFLEPLIPLPLKFVERKGRRSMFHDPGLVGSEWVDHLYEIRRMKGFSRMVVSTAKNLPGLTAHEDRVAEVRHPTVLLYGEEDRVATVEHGRLLQRILENATLEVIPECGHLPMIEKPQWTNRRILKFLPL